MDQLLHRFCGKEFNGLTKISFFSVSKYRLSRISLCVCCEMYFVYFCFSTGSVLN
jgi:hypothetical protein